MRLFDFFKKPDKKKTRPVYEIKSNVPKAVNQPTNEELYGKAWLMIAKSTKYNIGLKQAGLNIMNDLAQQGFSEAFVVLGMFAYSQTERKNLLKKAADLGNAEGIWEYSNFLPHSFCPNKDDPDDMKWVKTVVDAAEHGSVDAMNEMGNICNRWNHFSESMYWYAMANAHGHKDGQISMNGIARKWVNAGCPRDYQPGTEKFDIARFKCAISYLEIHSNVELSVSMDEIIKYNLSGTPIAAYLAGDIFEEMENYDMAYKMYNAIAFENDPHGLN